MNGMGARWLAAWLLASSARRLRTTRREWAEAMLAEAEMCASDVDRFRWALGCWVVSLRASCGARGIAYVAAVVAGLVGMTWYEWSADESRVTVVILSLITLLLGAMRPRQAVLSGVLVGLVVSGVTGFEALSGIRPAYEIQAQTLAHSVYWLILLPPALMSATLGAVLGRWRHQTHRLR